jgi:hypothetical protein
MGSPWRLLSLVAVVMVVGGCGTQMAPPDGQSTRPGGGGSAGSGRGTVAALTPLSDVQLDYQDEWGYLSVWGRFTPQRDGRVINSAMVAAGRTVHGFVFPPSFDTDNWPPVPHPRLRKGHVMRLLADVLPKCDGKPHQAPVVTVTSRRSNGRIVRSHFSVALKGKTPAQTKRWVEDVTHRFCALQVLVNVRRASGSADGQSVSFTYDLINPGPGKVTVTSRAWRSSGKARWLPASVVVPADGEQHELTVHGIDGICTTPGVHTPHELGLLVATGADGRRHVLTGDDDGGIDNVCQ